MDKISNGLGLGGAAIVIFFIGAGLTILEPTRKWGISCMSLGAGFLCLLGTKQASRPFNIIIGILGLVLLAACGILFAMSINSCEPVY